MKTHKLLINFDKLYFEKITVSKYFRNILNLKNFFKIFIFLSIFGFFTLDQAQALRIKKAVVTSDKDSITLKWSTDTDELLNYTIYKKFLGSLTISPKSRKALVSLISKSLKQKIGASNINNSNENRLRVRINSTTLSKLRSSQIRSLRAGLNFQKLSLLEVNANGEFKDTDVKDAGLYFYVLIGRNSSGVLKSFIYSLANKSSTDQQQTTPTPSSIVPTTVPLKTNTPVNTSTPKPTLAVANTPTAVVAPTATSTKVPASTVAPTSTPVPNTPIPATPATNANALNFSQSFRDGNIGSTLQWLDEDKSAWNMNNGRLNMRRYPGAGFFGGGNSRVPVLYYPNITIKDGLQVTVKAGFDVDRQYGQAGIMWFADNDTYTKFVTEYWFDNGIHNILLQEHNSVKCDDSEACGGKTFPYQGNTSVELRLTYKGGKMYSEFRKIGDSNWTPHHTTNAVVNGKVNIGLFSQADSGSSDWAWFQDLSIVSPP